MIAYLDSSVLTRAYLADEAEQGRVRELLDSTDIVTVSATLSRIEVTGALVRAARAHRGDEDALLAAFASDLAAAGGSLVLLDARQAEIEAIALQIVRAHGIRSLDAWHLACAALAAEELLEPGERLAFATRDAEQAAAARQLGFELV